MVLNYAEPAFSIIRQHPSFLRLPAQPLFQTDKTVAPNYNVIY